MSIINMLIFFSVCILQIGQAFAFSVVPIHQPHTKALATATYHNKFSIASQSAVPKPFNRPTTHRFYLHDYLTMSKGKDSTGSTDDTAPDVPNNNSTIAEFPTNDISLSFVLSTIISRIDKLDKRFDNMDTRFDKLDGRIDGIYLFLMGFLATGFYAALSGNIRFFGPP
jgi:hypothetical protein